MRTNHLKRVSGPYTVNAFSMLDRADPSEYAFEPEVVAAINAGRASLYIVGAEVSIQTANSWAVETTIGRSFLHGIIIDNGHEDDLISYAEQLVTEALQDASYTYSAMRKHPVPKAI